MKVSIHLVEKVPATKSGWSMMRRCLTEADLDGFSPGVRAIAVKMGAIVRMPREIVTRDPDTDEELPPRGCWW